MPAFPKFVLAFVATLVMAPGATGAQGPPGPPEPPVQDVEVVNSDEMPVPVTSEVEYRYTGLSTGFVRSFVGMNGMHEACRATFGPDARMCTTVEVFRTPDLASKPVREPGGSWVHPVIVDMHFNAAGNSIATVDFTGVQFGTGGGLDQGRGSCNGWQSPTNIGTGAIYAAPAGKRVVNQDRCIGGFEETKPVTCCLPRGLD